MSLRHSLFAVAFLLYIMAYRYSNTDKWNDSWFISLEPMEKLLFNYLCDNCNIAGFIEIIPSRWASDIKTDVTTIQGALKGLEKSIIYSNDNSVLYLKTFLKHQKNLPLNQNNKAHLGIISKFNNYLYKFNCQDINNFIQGALKGLSSPTGNGININNGNGNGNGNGTDEQEEKKHPLQIFIETEPLLKPILNIKTQLTYEQAEGLEKKYDNELIIEKIKRMANTKDIHLKSNSVALTIDSWCGSNKKTT